MTESENEILIRDKRIGADSAGNVSLNDVWMLAGSPPNARPADWRRGKRSKALHTALISKIVEIFHYSPDEAAQSSLYSTGVGRGARTFAHPVLALDYAEYLDPSIGVEVRDVFIRFRSNELGFALEILSEFAAQTDYDAERIKLRQLVKDHNKQSAGVAKDAEVTNYEAYNGAGLYGLYEMTRAQLLQHKGLPSDANHLDHANHEELAANYFKATQTVAKIRREKIRGQRNAEQAHYDVGQAVRQTIKDLGGEMSENEPALDNIREAQKRLKAADPDRAAELIPQRKKRA